MKRHNDASIHLHSALISWISFFRGYVLKGAVLVIMLVLASQVLLGCAPQPESMFEQQAEEEAANEIGAHSTIQNYELSKP